MTEKAPLVLMIEDNPDVLHLNEKWLRRCGCDTVCAETLAEARTVLGEKLPDLVVLDILLPDGDGLSFLPELRAVCAAPVLFCSSRNEDKDILRGLEAGGDDYIAKPYNVDILVARVKAMWRKEQANREMVRKAHAAQPPGHEITCGMLRLDMHSGRAYMCDVDVGLTPKEFALLLTLVQNKGREVSAKALYEKIWRLPSNGDVRTVKKHISQIRRKLAIHQDASVSITTEYGNGYVFEWNKKM